MSKAGDMFALTNGNPPSPWLTAQGATLRRIAFFNRMTRLPSHDPQRRWMPLAEGFQTKKYERRDTSHPVSMGDAGTLRKVTKKGAGPAGDVEEMLEEETAPRTAAPAPARPRGAATPGPASLAGAVFRGVVDHVTAPDEDDVSRPGGLLTLAKQVVLGVFLGIAMVAVLVYLDHLDVVHLESAHGLREVAFDMLNDPETLANLQEAAGFKFLSMPEYEAMRREVDEAPEKIAEAEEELRRKGAEGDETWKEAKKAEAYRETLLRSPSLGLDAYCGDCAWNGGITCAARVKFLQDTYHVKPLTGKITVMEGSSCRGGA